MKLKITVRSHLRSGGGNFRTHSVDHHFSQHSGSALLPHPAAAAGPEISDKVGRSPVAGVVVRIPAELGQAVQAGDPVVVLEAMKMETLITAAVAGTVNRFWSRLASPSRVDRPCSNSNNPLPYGGKGPL